MSFLRNITSGLRSLFRREQVDRELDEELRAYREMAAEEKMKDGMSRREALRAVRLERGNLEVAKEVVRSGSWEFFVETCWQDVRFAMRTLRKSRGFTAMVVLTLALGIGANTAIFTLVNAVMLKALPVANPGQLYRLGDNNNCCVMTGTQNDGSFVLYSYPLYKELRNHTPEFSQLAAIEPSLEDLSVRRGGGSATEPYKGEYVSGNYFAMFGIAPFAGRLLGPADDASGAPPAAVMSYHTWQKNFGSDPSVIGSTAYINGVACTIAGVTPRGFYGDTLRSDPPDFWLPLAAEPEQWRIQKPEVWSLYVIGRLHPDARPSEVQAKLTGELQQWRWATAYAEATPEELNDKAGVEKYRQEVSTEHVHLTAAAGGVQLMQTDYATGLRLLLSLSGLLLLIACANIANVLLARGSANRAQMAVRLALGAGRSRLIRQMLTESLLLALAGGLAGVYVAYAGAHAILLLAFRGAQYVPIDARPSLPVLVFALLVSLGTGIVFGIAPAWMASKCDPAGALRGAGRSGSDRSSAVQKPLLIAQVAFSIVLLMGAGLVTQSLRNLEGQQFGFVTDGRLIVNISPELSGYTAEKLPGLYERLEETMPQIPGVLSASLSWYSPFGGNNANERVYIQGKLPDDSGRAPSWDRVGPHYFETIGTRLLQGRVFDERDKPGAVNVAVINETFARRFFPNENPIGQRFGMGDETHSGDYEIVGVVEDTKYYDTRGPANATSFLPLLQAAPGDPFRGWVGAIELHVAGKPENLEPAVRKALASVDSNLTALNMVSFGEQVARNFNQERLIARLTELFGALALILACVGLYGVTAYGVARRTSEIGIRMALGADRRNVLGLVLRSALAQLGLGLAIGIPAALGGGYLLASQLYGVKSYDPAILGAAAVVLFGCATLAAYVPARRATRVDPLAALHYE